MKRFLLPFLSFSAVVALFSLRAAEPAPRQFGDATPLEWSKRMAQSEMARKGDTMFHGGSRARARWDYTTSLFGLSLLKLADRTGDRTFADYGAQTAESFIRPDGSIATYEMEDYNIDMIPPGKVMLLRWEQGVRDAKFMTALETLRAQMRKHPRTSDGGFWHKQRYPYQMWLDGLFMASPFLAHYAKVFEEPELFDEVAKQILLMDQHACDPKTGLHYHAWDEKRAQPWANKETGHSPNFWGRAEGWYAMALVDSLDFFSPTHPDVEKINEVLRRVADGVVRWQDPKTGLWWQVMDQGNREGNYLEATASSMFVYSLAKAINRGYLPREKYLPAVLKGYEGIIRDLIRRDPDGKINLTRCCAVAGLGYTTSTGRPRDGSFEYYISEPIIDNDLKGVGPFILAGLELDQLLADASGPARERKDLGARGWSDYEAVLARIQPPTFPDRDFPITDFGAKPDADCTDAIRAAIDACHQAGGGRVVVPAGEWLTGAIHLRSNVNLHVAKGATLRWVFDLAKYPIVFTRWEGVECMNFSPFIYAWEQENIAITGEGTLDGGSDWSTWWGWNDKRDGTAPKQRAARNRLIQMGETNVPVAERVFGANDFLRPNFVQPYRCKNILIEGVSIIRSPMWELHPVLSQNITVRNVKITSHGPNNDGFDPESCRDILVEDTLFDTGDDCIAIKSGRNGDGRRVNVPTENMVIRRCVMKDGHGGVVLGSECTGGIRNIFVEDCEMDSPDLDRGLRFKNNAVRGGVLENVFMRNVKIGRVGEAVLTIDLLYEEGAKGAFKPIVRNVQMENITSSASPRVMYIRGFPGAVIEDIRISNSTFNSVTETEVVQHAGTITLKNVTITPAKGTRSLNSVPAPQK
ncbi:glycoside hydrolase family 88 protein [Opitutus terrae]|uniref:Glycosyl hydrolase family 88 n=1 Tax=Opitutus terrae (strain DSM 11246 / JCM 15787 / PB90-1) TaxID=452637 RepID=B1ZP57_OPITP|nr:glycoside hydrolase family 88 protein [Opitutus terrae]ACB77543.1 glycosyl hydrolase family 88 [Opitutus terrae PB90-1]